VPGFVSLRTHSPLFTDGIPGALMSVTDTDLDRPYSWNRIFASRPWLLPLVGLLVGGDIEVWRAYKFIFSPQFWAEGGAVWYADAYNRGALAPLLHRHAGYVGLFPRLIADLGLLFPLGLVPSVFVAIVLFVQVLSGVFFLTERFSDICPSSKVRFFIALVYFAIPNPYEDSGKLTTVVWRLALLALMIVIARPPRPCSVKPWMGPSCCFPI
jgi:hypothetical protein